MAAHEVVMAHSDMGRQALADMVGKSKRTVYRYLREGGAPLVNRRHNLVAMAAWVKKAKCPSVAAFANNFAIDRSDGYKFRRQMLKRGLLSPGDFPLRYEKADIPRGVDFKLLAAMVLAGGSYTRIGMAFSVSEWTARRWANEIWKARNA